jgi:hypothetical protein
MLTHTARSFLAGKWIHTNSVFSLDFAPAYPDINWLKKLSFHAERILSCAAEQVDEADGLCTSLSRPLCNPLKLLFAKRNVNQLSSVSAGGSSAKRPPSLGALRRRLSPAFGGLNRLC